jgi:CheY-like chemotaxis protein
MRMFQRDTTKTESKAKTSSEPHRRSVLIVDNHPLFRHGLATLINAQPDLVTCCEAASAPSALETMRRCPSDVAVLDISLPGMNNLELVKAIRAEQPELPILVLSGMTIPFTPCEHCGLERLVTSPREKLLLLSFWRYARSRKEKFMSAPGLVDVSFFK